MADTKSTNPGKQYQEFSMFPHASGQWAKKIEGMMWYFGTWEDHDGALQKYNDWIHEIYAGSNSGRSGVPHVYSDTLSVADLCNLFRERQPSRVETGSVSNRHFSGCLKSWCFPVNHFSKFMRASALRAVDFQNLRSAFPAP